MRAGSLTDRGREDITMSAPLGVRHHDRVTTSSRHMISWRSSLFKRLRYPRSIVHTHTHQSGTTSRATAATHSACENTRVPARAGA